MRSVLVLMSGMLFAYPALAENVSGNDLLSICETTNDTAKLGYCIGYISGVIEGMKWGISVPLVMSGTDTAEAEKTGNTLLGFCLPAEASLGQMRDVILLYLQNNPVERHTSARIQVQLALAGAYPCTSE